MESEDAERGHDDREPSHASQPPPGDSDPAVDPRLVTSYESQLPTAAPRKDKDSEAPIVGRLVESGQAETELRELQWLHPTSILFGLLSTVRQFFVAAVVALFLASSGNRIAFVAAAVGVGLTTIGAIFRYFTLRYQLVDGELRIQQGLIFHRHRTIPASRIQNIDLIQNPLHHLFKVAEVSIETAGGSEPEAKLQVLGLSDVDRLRAAIFGTRQTHSPTADGSAEPTVDMGVIPSSGTHLVHKVSLKQLMLAGLISNRGFVLIPLALGLFYQLDLDERIDPEQIKRYSRLVPQDLTVTQTLLVGLSIGIVMMVVVKLFSIAWYVLRFYGHRIERHGDDLRVSCGLFTRVSATVPRKRIQFISIQQTLLGRWVGLAVIRLETAGGAGKPGEDAKASVARRWFVPVISKSAVSKLLPELRPGLEFDPEAMHWRGAAPRTHRRLLRIALLQALAAGGVTCVASWRAGLGVGLFVLAVAAYFARRYARSLKYSADKDRVVFRSGIVTRKVSMTFFDKIQAVSLHQTPFDRRWDMSTLRIDTAAAGPAQHRIFVKYLPAAVAVQEAEWVAWQARCHKLDSRGPSAESDVGSGGTLPSESAGRLE